MKYLRRVGSYWAIAALFSAMGCATTGTTDPGLYARPFPYPVELPGASIEVYKHASDRDLNLYIFNPRGHHAGDRRATIVFFFGGGWNNGSPGQFYAHAAYFTSRGMVVALADYRVRSRDGVLAADCVRDGKSAIRYLRANARRLGVDPLRIAAGGGSAGGHVAASTGLLPGMDEPTEDYRVRSTPNALVLFNPVLVTAATDSVALPEARLARLRDRLGVDLEALSPYHHVKPGLPPTIVFHGTDDTTVPFETARVFVEAMREAGNRCELAAYDGRGHGFFNFTDSSTELFAATVREADRFLDDVGFLNGRSHVKRFLR